MRILTLCLLPLIAADALEEVGPGHHRLSAEAPHSHKQVKQSAEAKRKVNAEPKESHAGGTKTETKKAQNGQAKNEAEVTSKGHLTHHGSGGHKHMSQQAASLMEVEVHGPDSPVAFFQEDSEQGPFHKARETRVVSESGEEPELVRREEDAKLSDEPDADNEDDEVEEDLDEDGISESEAEEAKNQVEEDGDDFSLPRGDQREELQGHSDAAAVAELASPSIMRREVDGVQHQLAMEMVAKRWLGIDGDHGSKARTHRRRLVLVCSLLGMALVFMLLAVTKADKVIKSVLSHVSLSTEPTGSELQEPLERKDTEPAAKSKDAPKSLASFVEGLAPCASVRKLSKDDKEEPASGLRRRIEALPVSAAAEVEQLLPSTGGYDVNFSKPMSSRQLLRLEAIIEDSQDAEPLLSPLTRRSCVLYTAHASRKVHGGMPLPVAFASQHVDFTVTLLGTPRVAIRVAGSEVNLFATSECEFAEVLPFPCAPEHWQDFVSVHLSSAGTGSSDNHALENELRAKGTAVEFHECCLVTGATVTLVGELMRSASGELTLQPLSQEQVSWKRTSWEKAGLAEGNDLELLEAKTNVLISDDPTLLSSDTTSQAEA
eukprot:CAMPEP_0181444354 /NCGR_PEP_ID=MMETSP1110-20121109/25025_1 /TAXON_ID=174948 /ORGANISM="Symbiodinium sp., Strain CCMP421" /LENGTH=602 /DNA_ID=CAMNT_0023568357 /DNA_START=149 /DNA_END=1957 /DNA_ORIENTATION=-